LKEVRYLSKFQKKKFLKNRNQDKKNGKEQKEKRKEKGKTSSLE